MANLKNIKLKISSVKKTRQVTKAMEAVSAVKMRKTQSQAIAARPYATAALSILKRLSGSIEASRHPLTQGRDGKTCVVAVTSDKGLAGALNSNMLRRIERTLRERNLTSENAVVLAIGRRGADYLSARGYTIVTRLENVSDDVSEAEMREITQTILGLHERGEIGSCVVVYTNFLSTFEQAAVARQLIPMTPEVLDELVAGIVPAKGKFAEIPEVAGPATYTIEPSADAVMHEVMPRLLSVAFFHALAEAKASEHSARMVAMKNATDKAGEVAHELTLKFNKARQAAITGEVSEITSGIEALK